MTTTAACAAAWTTGVAPASAAEEVAAGEVAAGAAAAFATEGQRGERSVDAPDAGEAAADAEAESDLLPFRLAPATLTEPEEESAVDGRGSRVEGPSQTIRQACFCRQRAGRSKS